MVLKKQPPYLLTTSCDASHTGLRGGSTHTRCLPTFINMKTLLSIALMFLFHFAFLEKFSLINLMSLFSQITLSQNYLPFLLFPYAILHLPMSSSCLCHIVTCIHASLLHHILSCFRIFPALYFCSPTHLFIKQILVENLLCASHCPWQWEYSYMRGRLRYFLGRTYILVREAR